MRTKQLSITSSPWWAGWTVLGLTFCTAAFPITWNFDVDGDAQGWSAFDGPHSGRRFDMLASLPSEVRDGIWRISAPQAGESIMPSVELLSPRIDRDCKLFDRLTIRLRVVQANPSIGGIGLRWTIPFNEHAPGLDFVHLGAPHTPEEVSFAAGLNVWQEGIAYSSHWQEYTVSELYPGAPVPGSPRATLSWQGTLFDIRTELLLSSTLPVRQWPEALEVDWIRLTGVEEQLQGEFLPPIMARDAIGTLLTRAAASSVPQRGLADYSYNAAGSWPTNPGGLCELDGDGELELLLRYTVGSYPLAKGWVELDCRNGSSFGLSARHAVDLDSPLQLVTADANRDGRSDLLIMRWGVGGAFRSQVLLNRPEEGWIAGQEWPADEEMMGWADGDGDGWVDAWGKALREGRFHLLFHRGLGDGSFSEARSLVLDSAQRRFYPWRFVPHVGARNGVGVLWASLDDRDALVGHGYELTYLEREGELVVQHLAADVLPVLVRYAGDVDDDGDIDLLVAAEECRMVRQGNCTRGLSLWVNQGDGSFSRADWLPEAVLPVGIPEPVLVLDLDGDGRKDYALVDLDEHQPSLWVGLGQPGGGIRTEGRYLLEGNYGSLYAGDVDRDGDPDLVTVRGDAGSEGVQVWRNDGYRSTPVSETPAAVPAEFHLGPCYPNPFNPQAWIPVNLPAADRSVSLRIYNLLGQPVRTLVNGRLEPGSHTIPWDGKDDSGRPLPSGVYLCRLLTAGYQETLRMVKVE